MADDALTVVDASSTQRTLRSRDVASGVQAQKIDASPWVPTTTGHLDSQDVTTSSGVTLSPPAGSTHLLVTVEDNDVRFTEDGSTSPTTGATGTGMVLPAGFIGELAIPVGGGLKFIAVSATAELNGSYRKYV